MSYRNMLLNMNMKRQRAPRGHVWNNVMTMIHPSLFPFFCIIITTFSMCMAILNHRLHLYWFFDFLGSLCPSPPSLLLWSITVLTGKTGFNWDLLCLGCPHSFIVHLGEKNIKKPHWSLPQRGPPQLFFSSCLNAVGAKVMSYQLLLGCRGQTAKCHQIANQLIQISLHWAKSLLIPLKIQSVLPHRSTCSLLCVCVLTCRYKGQRER